MALSQISWLLLALQVVLLAATAFGPFFFWRHWYGYLIYSGTSWISWMGYMMLALAFNARVGLDTPGGGYLLIGLVGWTFGTVVYLFRIIQSRKANRNSGRAGSTHS